MSEPRNRYPNEVAAQLQISPSTLRRWSNEFADFMSDSAGRPQPEEGGRTPHRRYTDEDVEMLVAIKDLLAEGLTYIQVARRLEALRARQNLAEADEEEGQPRVTVLGPSMRDAAPLMPAVTVLADTLHTVAEGQQLLMGSQQANRDLLSVVLQDNFSLKEENSKLRDRMLGLERDLAEMRRMDETRRENLEVRLQEIEERTHRHSAQPKRTERQGCLAQIFGPLS